VTKHHTGTPLPLPQVDSCYFCGIIERKADAWNLIEETDLTLTLLNGRQFEVGQCIVVPRRHAPTLLELTSAEGNAVMAAAKRAVSVMVAAFTPDGVLLYQNNGVGSGQEVPHFHMHVVPRRSGSNWGFGPPHIARAEQDRRPLHADHEVVTDGKRATVDQLRRAYSSLGTH
jgi:diadenosine tetraphosphate (Ap4A) HIT family hydrolase